MPGACLVQASGTHIPLLSPVLQVSVEVADIMDLIQILAKGNFILDRQMYNLQEGTMQVGREFFLQTLP